MSEHEAEGQPDPAAPEEKPAGGFAKDKQFGRRLDQVVAIGEPFLLLGAVADEPIATVYGDSSTAKILLQRLDPATGAPKGAPVKATTVLSAVVEKVLAVTQIELAAGPIVQLEVVKAKARGGKNVTVLSWVRNLADADDFSEFGLDPEAVSRAQDLARPEGERIPY